MQLGEGSKVSKRMSLVEGLKRDQDELDPETIETFVKQGNAVAKPKPERNTEAPPEKPRLQKTEAAPEARPHTAVMSPGLIPVNVRVRPDIAQALKAAALERELQGIEPFTKREIVEQALEPWLKKNGYL
jgi:hypothetical protein